MPLSLFHLHGDLKDLRFPRLLAALREDDFTGAFQAAVRGDGPDAEITREVHFLEGSIAWAISTDPEESLRAYLLRNGAITEAQWLQAEEAARETSLRQALVDLGFVAAGELNQIERGRAEEIVLALFSAEQGEYRVRERQLSPGTPHLKIDPRALILKGVLEGGDRALILEEIGSLDTVYVVKRPVLEEPGLNLPGEFQSVLRLIDGKRSVAQICSLTSMPDYFVCSVFAALSMVGAVKGSHARSHTPRRPVIVKGAEVASTPAQAPPASQAASPSQTGAQAASPAAALRPGGDRASTPPDTIPPIATRPFEGEGPVTLLEVDDEAPAGGTGENDAAADPADPGHAAGLPLPGGSGAQPAAARSLLEEFAAAAGRPVPAVDDRDPATPLTPAPQSDSLPGDPDREAAPSRQSAPAPAAPAGPSRQTAPVPAVPAAPTRQAVPVPAAPAAPARQAAPVPAAPAAPVRQAAPIAETPAGTPRPTPPPAAVPSTSPSVTGGEPPQRPLIRKDPRETAPRRLPPIAPPDAAAAADAHRAPIEGWHPDPPDRPGMADERGRPWFLLGGAVAVGAAALFLILMAQSPGDAVENRPLPADPTLQEGAADPESEGGAPDSSGFDPGRSPTGSRRDPDTAGGADSGDGGRGAIRQGGSTGSKPGRTAVPAGGAAAASPSGSNAIPASGAPAGARTSAGGPSGTASGSPVPVSPSPGVAAPPGSRMLERPGPAGGSEADLGRQMMLTGDYRGAARHFGREVAAGPGAYSIQLLMACQDDTIRRAVASGRSSPEMFLLSTTFQGRSCYRVYWGRYATQKRAQEALLRDIPAAFRSERPRVTRLAGS